MNERRLKVLVQVRGTLAARIANRVPDTEIVPIPEEGDLADEADGEVLLTLPRATPNLGQALGRGVRWVHALGTGIDAFPLHLLGDRMLTCSRGASAVPISEWVLAMMLAFEKRLPGSWIRSAPAQGWSRARLGTLNGKTLGLVGLGGIGSAVAARALPFGMRILACRRTAAPSSVAGVEVLASLPELLGSSDHVVIAAPATPATRHLLNGETLARVKPGAHLVNVSRGALVDQGALRAALDDGAIAMASLDAVEPEPLPPGHWLYTHPRVRLSAHVSWHMPGALDLLIEPFIDNLRRYRAGEPLAGIVDRAAGY